jgi:hypothetical protein
VYRVATGFWCRRYSTVISITHHAAPYLCHSAHRSGRSSCIHLKSDPLSNEHTGRTDRQFSVSTALICGLFPYFSSSLCMYEVYYKWRFLLEFQHNFATYNISHPSVNCPARPSSPRPSILTIILIFFSVSSQMLGYCLHI